MSKKSAKGRGHFTSSIGFIMAAAGSAIGLGNLWKFPYIAGSSGGGFFIVFYILFALILGVPITLSEMGIGRSTQLNAIGAFHKLNPKWAFVGAIDVLCAFTILSYYSVVGGWVLKYISVYLLGGDFGESTSTFFGNFVGQGFESAVWHIVFLAFCGLVVIGGVAAGIERVSKWMMPGLFALLIIVAVRSALLPNAVEGLKFLFVPRFEIFSSFSELSNVIVLAMGQVFFSLSLGLGITITYGSYLKKESNMPRNTYLIVGLDTLIAVLAGIAILPAVFSFGFEPTAGPSLIFETLPAVFDSTFMGRLFGLLFFVLVFFAAATSAIALFEVVVAYFIDHFHWKRRNAAIILGSLMGIIGIFALLSMGPMSNLTIAGMNLFDALGFLTDKILMPLAALFTCVFVGHVWGIDKVTQEIEQNGVQFRIRGFFTLMIKFVAPVLILVIFVIGLMPA